MVDKLTVLVECVAQWTLTYWLHSTLVLGLAALGFIVAQRIAVRRCDRLCESHALWGRVWKFAAIAGVITASLQMSFGTGFHLGASGLFSGPNVPVVPSSSGPLAGISASEPVAVAHSEVDALAQLQRVLNQLETLDSLFPAERQPTIDAPSGFAPAVGGERETSQPLNAASVPSMQTLSPLRSRSVVHIDEAEPASNNNASISPFSPHPTGVARADPTVGVRIEWHCR